MPPSPIEPLLDPPLLEPPLLDPPLLDPPLLEPPLLDAAPDELELDPPPSAPLMTAFGSTAPSPPPPQAAAIAAVETRTNVGTKACKRAMKQDPSEAKERRTNRLHHAMARDI